MKAVNLIVVLLASIWAFQDDSSGKPVKKREMKDRQWMEGTIVCIGCTLAKEYGADVECTLHSKHAQGFRDKDGKIWTLIDNTRGHQIMTNSKLRGAHVRVFGWAYKKHQYFEFWKYSVKDGENWEDHDYCKICGFEPGDHKDTDLCPDCSDG